MATSRIRVEFPAGNFHLTYGNINAFSTMLKCMKNLGVDMGIDMEELHRSVVSDMWDAAIEFDPRFDDDDFDPWDEVRNEHERNKRKRSRRRKDRYTKSVHRMNDAMSVLGSSSFATDLTKEEIKNSHYENHGEELNLYRWETVTDRRRRESADYNDSCVRVFVSDDDLNGAKADFDNAVYAIAECDDKIDELRDEIRRLQDKITCLEEDRCWYEHEKNSANCRLINLMVAKFAEENMR